MKRGVRTLIEVEHLTKRYGGHTAVDDIDVYKRQATYW